MITREQMMAMMEKMVMGYRDAGGSPDCFLVINAENHAKHLDGASAILGIPVAVRDWAEHPKVYLMSARDLANADDGYGAPWPR